MAGKVVSGMASQNNLCPTGFGGYTEELARAEDELARLESRLRHNPGDLEKWVRYAYRLFHRASLRGIATDFAAVEAAIWEGTAKFGPKEDLCLLQANLDFRFHRLAQVRCDLQTCPLLSGRFEGRVLLAELDFQEGRYAEARFGFERLIEENCTWDNLARLAHWHSKFGDITNADELYEKAEDDLTAKQMRSYAWLELQRGSLAFTHGNYTKAWMHYHRAEKAYPGYWQIAEHVAELLAAECKFDEAEAMFQKIVDRIPKPELQQALGEFYLLIGRSQQAQLWLDRALAAYLQSVRDGETHYFHHLADFYCDAHKSPEEAVLWASKDLELRSNFSTQTAMAWSLYHNNQPTQALEYIGLALSSGVRDAQIFSTAAIIFEAAGEMQASHTYSRAALEINPRYQSFHMHH
jgi:tetratricopeptide (TPR) repeat protein